MNWEELRQKTIERDDGRCRKCKLKAKEAHHITPKRFGGEDKIENLVILCKRDHAIADNIYAKYGMTAICRIWLKENEEAIK